MNLSRRLGSYPRASANPPNIARQRQRKSPTTPRKPQGPLIIAISIEKQSLRLYDGNGFFAETPISTGTRDHPTPMGVFSIIQKRKLHHSNIYSGAPMPYMQRITWSGIAMHAGVLPGYPASHGCIRMPTAFAVKMWNWTRMGARVVITPGEITPSSFSHPVLVAQKQIPQPVADATIQPAVSNTALNLRSTVGHDLAKPDANGMPALTKLRGQTHTADASSAMSPAEASVTVSDAMPSVEASVADTKSELADGKPATAPAGERLETEIAKSAVAKAGETKIEAAEVDGIKAAAPAPATDVPDVKDPTRPPDIERAAPPKPDLAPAPKRPGQIAVLVSRKDGRLYVRQNFAPLFDVPVTIAASDRSLGTHVFTAQIDKDDPDIVRWSVVSLPARYIGRRDDDERAAQRRKTTGAVEMKSAPEPDSAAGALDRLTIPADAIARITDALSTGGSIIVSDQGIATGETGEGTDFIIPLR